MFCEAYNQLLRDAAASGELSPTLQQHLASCAACRGAFAEEQSLFAAIDAGLQVTTNSEVPATLIPRIRVTLNDEPTPQRRGFAFLAWGATCVAATAAVALALVYLPSKQKPLPIESAPVVAVTTTQNPPNQTAVNSVRAGGVSPVQHNRPVVMVLSRDSKPVGPEVLVPPDDKDTLLRYEEFLRRKSTAGIQSAARSLDMPREIEPLEIAELELGDLRIPTLPKPALDGQAK